MTHRAAQFDRRSCSPRGGALRAFTLMELLVVMGIITLLSAVTALTYRAVAKDAKLSSAKNTIMAVLDHARSLAMRDNTIVVVVFRPRLDGREQYIETVVAKWTGQSGRFSSPDGLSVIDRYIPIANVEPRRIASGVQVAGPYYRTSLDDQWITLSHLPGIDNTGMGEAAGAILGVMYSPTGQTIFYNAKSDAEFVWIDFDNDSKHEFNGAVVDYWPDPPAIPNFPQAQLNAMFDHTHVDDEPVIALVPFFAVFDDEQARQLYDVTQWNSNVAGGYAAAQDNRIRDYTQYVTENADRIHFNRYTGVAMK